MPRSNPSPRRLALGRWLLPTGLLALGAYLVLQPAGHAADAVLLPAPTVDETAANAGTSETAVFAGGCFWGVQGVFQHVAGVSRAVSGYAGGVAGMAHYERVEEGDTGHAESVEVTYDPHQVTYGQLLRIFFSVAHDPTELNRQGPDVGPQYRSAIFIQNAEQQRVAAAYLDQLGRSSAFARPIVTKLEPFKGFYPAESQHQDFLARHPSYPYIAINDMPKLKNFERLFPVLYRAEPVLVSPATD
ncbi:peptide methionine sulfoxide reductase MsrA [Aliidongia dinghuensis]|uniref:Peptide methionine sulfoxide reductase MsrA n=1 Tax=Aliidongia dinghuensis TaxID=1867774 RepID=A0A8J2YV58_9PROT|nr:peptide-methionine (S)-S-oxide reductase MsrA [Aliidongia dinghuensis]GGF25867.1 peptide methionine sulfoxide reductase MsrA [Aliidongia dinghuensis]